MLNAEGGQREKMANATPKPCHGVYQGGDHA
jgi:hypothetical protein